MAGTAADNTNMGTAAKRAVNPDKPLGVRERRERLLRLLPQYNFKIAPAAIAVGYGETYAKRTLPGRLNKDAEFCRRLDVIREQDCRFQQNKTDAVDTKLRNILDDLDVPTSLKLKAIELYYRRHGLLTDHQVVDSGDRQRELTDAQTNEARKLAVHLMRNKGQTNGKPLPKPA